MINYLKAPKIINIELTSYCPLNCKQCYKRKENLDEIHLDFNRLNSIIDEAGKINISKILFSGGEPFYYKYFNEAVKLVKKNNFILYISTGGYGITYDKLTYLKQYKLDALYISLNGSTKEINDKSRYGFVEAINTMELSKKIDLPIRINWVARSDNVYDFKNILTLAEKYHVEEIDILRNKPDDSGNISSQLTYEELKYLAECYINYSNPSVKLNIESCYNELRNLCKIRIKNSVLKGCSGGKYSLSVNAKGEFSPCAHMRSTTYTSNYERIIDFWEKSDEIKRFRIEKSYDYCKTCSYKEYCFPCIIAKEKSECLIKESDVI